MPGGHVYSVLGVGFGPANLALAVAQEERRFVGPIGFVERAPHFQWQSEQLLPGTDIQNNPFRDIAMPRNQDSDYTFVKYLAARGMLTEYLHLNAKFPLRSEYSAYLEWVAGAFGSSVRYGTDVVDVGLTDSGGEELFAVRTGGGERLLTRALVLGTGRTPRIPGPFETRLGPTVFHSSRYLSMMRGLGRSRTGLRVAVVGSSQSAIEIVLDLLNRPEVDCVTSIQRGIGFRQKDTSPYSRQVFLPEFVDYFHSLPKPVRARLRAQLRSINYGACDSDVIDQLALRQREYRLSGSDRLRILSFTEVAATRTAVDGREHGLVLRDVNDATATFGLDVDAVVLATGYRDLGTEAAEERLPALLSGVADRLVLDDDVPVVERDYSVPLHPGPDGRVPPRLYLNGLCEASHGMGDAGALAMLSVRAEDIAGSLGGDVRCPAGVATPALVTETAP